MRGRGGLAWMLTAATARQRRKEKNSEQAAVRI